MTQLIRWATWGAMGASLLLVGCATQVDVGEAEAGLVLVRKADYAGHVRYIDDSVSVRPMTAEELGDTRSATPVEVRFYDDVAIAWYAPNGVAETGDPRNVIRVWHIEDHVAIDSDDVAPGDDTHETTAPGAPPSFRDQTPGFSVGDTAGVDAKIPLDFGKYLPFARLDWLLAIEEWQNGVPGFHPGCT